MTDISDKKHIKELIRSSSSQVTFEAIDKAGPQWTKLRRIIVNSQRTPFLICSCTSMLKYTPTGGTGAVIKHKCSNGQQQSTTTRKAPTAEMKKTITEVAAICSAKDCLPFAFIEGNGFKLLAQSLIDIGAEFGHVDANQLLPVGTTVRRTMERIFTDLSDKLKNILSQLDVCSFTLDHWKSGLLEQRFLTTVIHYIHNEELKTRILQVKPVDSGDADHTLNYFEECISTYDISSKVMTVVTDNCSTMRSAFEFALWVGCSSHQLNLVLQHSFSELERTYF